MKLLLLALLIPILGIGCPTEIFEIDRVGRNTDQVSGELVRNLAQALVTRDLHYIGSCPENPIRLGVRIDFYSTRRNSMTLKMRSPDGVYDTSLGVSIEARNFPPQNMNGLLIIDESLYYTSSRVLTNKLLREFYTHSERLRVLVNDDFSFKEIRSPLSQNILNTDNTLTFTLDSIEDRSLLAEFNRLIENSYLREVDFYFEDVSLENLLSWDSVSLESMGILDEVSKATLFRGLFNGLSKLKNEFREFVGNSFQSFHIKRCDTRCESRVSTNLVAGRYTNNTKKLEVYIGMEDDSLARRFIVNSREISRVIIHELGHALHFGLPTSVSDAFYHLDWDPQIFGSGWIIEENHEHLTDYAENTQYEDFAVTFEFVHFSNELEERSIQRYEYFERLGECLQEYQALPACMRTRWFDRFFQ